MLRNTSARQPQPPAPSYPRLHVEEPGRYRHPRGHARPRFRAGDAVRIAPDGLPMVVTDANPSPPGTVCVRWECGGAVLHGQFEAWRLEYAE